MARRPRASRLETRTARLKFAVREKPYDFTTISPGIALGYRRNRTAGTWVVRVADGHGGNWTKRVGIADDFEEADGEQVLTWWQAIEAARRVARGSADAGRPTTVKDAVNAYERDLIARGGERRNAGRIHAHLTPTLASKPVGLLTARELAAWRDSLLTARTAATVVRICRSAKAALNLAARRDPRITNNAAWRDGLGGISEGFVSRNLQRLTDDEVRAVVAAAYEISFPFGLYVETAAVTGARPSQVAKLVVADLQDGANPRLMVPASRKGRNRKPAKIPVPITPELAHKLATDRPADSPLLLRADGRAWQPSNNDHARLYRQAAECAGVSGTTFYSLRHSSIVRALAAGIPVRVVCAAHDTSVAMVERTYSAFITHHTDALMRGALLSTAPPAGKAVPIAGRRS
jgi:integrase